MASTKASEVYELTANLDDPRYEGFAFASSESLRGKRDIYADFMPDDIATRGRKWTAPRLSSIWRPRQVEGRVRSYNDYPAILSTLPTFSRRAVDALRDLLEANGELLPVKSQAGEYYAYNVTTVADALDLEQSKVTWYDKKDKDIAQSIRKYCFRPDVVARLSIFRLVESTHSTYVTEVFMERVLPTSCEEWCSGGSGRGGGKCWE